MQQLHQNVAANLNFFQKKSQNGELNDLNASPDGDNQTKETNT